MNDSVIMSTTDRQVRRQPFWTHKRVSYLKSGVRIKACVLAALMPTAQAGVVVLALGLAAAEWLGVWEEWGARG